MCENVCFWMADLLARIAHSFLKQCRMPLYGHLFTHNIVIGDIGKKYHEFTPCSKIFQTQSYHKFAIDIVQTQYFRSFHVYQSHIKPLHSQWTSCALIKKETMHLWISHHFHSSQHNPKLHWETRNELPVLCNAHNVWLISEILHFRSPFFMYLIVLYFLHGTHFI